MIFNGGKASKPCPLCGSTERVFFYELIDIPTSCNILWKEKSQAVNCPKGDILLCFCTSCSFIFNYALEPSKNQYDSRYDNSLVYSSLFQDFAKKMTMNLIQRYNLHNKTIMEATVGKVDFLSFFCTLGPNNGVKFDTSLVNAQGNGQTIKSASYDLIRDDRLVDSEKRKIDFVFSYHELEHANDPKRFLYVLKERVGEDSNAIFYISVPNIYKAFSEGDFTDVIYEHPSYFTIPSLRSLFTCYGYNVLNIIEEGEGFYSSISVVASLAENAGLNCKASPKMESDNLKSLVLAFADKSKIMVEKASNQIKPLLDQGKRVVVWGAGARGVTFLNILKDLRIEYVVDINPQKQGMYIPGTGQKIVEPKFLLTYKPDMVIIANSSYQSEIRKMLADIKLETNFILL